MTEYHVLEVTQSGLLKAALNAASSEGWTNPSITVRGDILIVVMTRDSGSTPVGFAEMDTPLSAVGLLPMEEDEPAPRLRQNTAPGAWRVDKRPQEPEATGNPDIPIDTLGPEPPPVNGLLRGIDYAILAYETFPEGEEPNLTQLSDKMLEMGWQTTSKNPPNVLRAIVSQDDRFRSLGDGTWAYTPAAESEDS